MYIRDRMRAWRPRRKRDLFVPGYDDRFTYYTQLFALFIAAIGTVGVVLSIVQTAYAVIATDDNSVEMAVDSVETAVDRVETAVNNVYIQMGALLNVSQEILLALRDLRSNGTG